MAPCTISYLMIVCDIPRESCMCPHGREWPSTFVCSANLHYSVSMLVIGTVIIIFFMLICFCRFSPCIHFLYLIVHFGVIIMLQVWKNSNGTCQNSRTNAQPKCLLLVYLLTANVIFDLQSCCSLKLFFFFFLVLSNFTGETSGVLLFFPWFLSFLSLLSFSRCNLGLISSCRKMPTSHKWCDRF